jgi:short-subunit dehydrogenase
MSRTTPRETALITGASMGIGAVYADRLARRGHNLVLVARSRDRLEELATRLRAEHGVAVEVLPADLGDAADLARVERLLREDAGITMLVNNAGMAGGGSVAEADLARYDAVIGLNVTALTHLSAAVAARFAAAGHGTIVNVGSVTALMAGQFEPVYLATKSYVLTFTQTLAAELATSGVRVQAVLPGVTRTEIWASTGRDVGAMPREIVMEPGDMVDAALAGLDLGETVTIPSLPDAGGWERLEAARLALLPDLSRDRPAARYRVAA